MGKRRHHNGSRHDLEEAFAALAAEDSAYMHDDDYTLRSKFAGYDKNVSDVERRLRSIQRVKPLPPTLRIGDRVIAKVSGLFHGYKGQRDRIPMIVYGIERENQEIVAADLFKTSVNTQKVYSNDTLIEDSRVLMELHENSGMPVRIATNSILTLPNESAYFSKIDPREILGRLPDELIGEMIGCRLLALLRSNNQLQQTIVTNALSSPQTVREGITFSLSEQDFSSRMFPKTWSVDLPGGTFQRELAGVVSPEELRRITSYVVQFVDVTNRTGKIYARLPPFREWFGTLSSSLPSPVRH